MPWSSLVLATDAELGNIEPEATSSTRPWGAASWPKAIAEAKRDLKIWLERDYAAQLGLPSVADRVLDRWAPEWVFGYTGGAYTDLTTKTRDDEPEDVDLAAALATFGTDRLYIGAGWEFEGVALQLLDSLNAITSVLTVKYWSPTGWAALQVVDGTAVSGKTGAQSGRVTWQLPTDWAMRRLNGTGDEYFWVELSVSAALTAGTAISQLLTVRAPDGLKRVAVYLALAHIFRGLSVGASDPTTWLSRAQNEQRTGYLDLAEDLYAGLRDKGGIPIDLTRNQAIETAEQRVTNPLRMRRG